MESFQRSLISPQIKNIFYENDTMSISVKLYSAYNIYCNSDVVIHLIMENKLTNKIYKYEGNIRDDIFDCKISKDDLRIIKEDLQENLLSIEVSNLSGDILAKELIKGVLWDEDEIFEELHYDDDTLNLLISNEKDRVNICISKEICIDEIDEIQKYFDNLKILFKSEKDISKYINENLKCNLSINNKEYCSNNIEPINESSFYAYYRVEDENNIVEDILKNDIFNTVILQDKKYKSKIDVVNKEKIYKSTYEVFKLKMKELFID